jgi:hypothetical protein
MTDSDGEQKSDRHYMVRRWPRARSASAGAANGRWHSVFVIQFQNRKWNRRENPNNIFIRERDNDTISSPGS